MESQTPFNLRNAWTGLRRLRVAMGVAAGLLLVACPSPDGNTTPDPEPEVVTPDPGPENGTIGNLDAAAHDEMSQSPFDATLSPDGTNVYYIALATDEDGDNVPGVFTVPATGGTPTQLAMGEPLQGPSGIDISLDGNTLLIADASSESDADDEEADANQPMGAVLTMPVGGGTPTALSMTQGYAPSGVVVAAVGGDEYTYFTGRDPVAGMAGLFRMPGNGGAVETVATGEPFADPGGVAVNKDGVAFVVDGDPNQPLARVIKVEDGQATEIVSDIGVGYPAGIALSKDETVFLVSGIDPETGGDIVYRVVIETLEMGTLSDGISEFAESAGLHRAHDVEAYAWADSEADGTGTVYVLTPPAPEAAD